ncbi:MAG TPA: 16S rRNA (cytidine(1402)-2'-O)-methyltransferase [Bacteroidales bacterium]|nr:16S rRNA (cytidine(1402)-2'-O)-methyltransferase [Bacteroidales bacterium]HOH94376.1 16S rRNA (cytidine(1402)-2'-O)-methyltransferase [Bacteroidales bacterium]HPM40358.1 16S rRNA (cytidine(1402)-2'-O)-methyltransferase [Bacteroidales bacterium]
MSHILHLVPTPIGNLEDITIRSLNYFKQADLVICEDTRSANRLFRMLDIDLLDKKFLSYHKDNEHRIVDMLINEIRTYTFPILLSEAGMPAISDPGYLLIRNCIKAGLEIEVIPGASAVLVALVGSGLPCDKFHFEGFLPTKSGRKQRLEFIKNYPFTSVIYESPYRINKTLQEMLEFFSPDHPIAIGRELTKMHEEFIRGQLSEIVEQTKDKKWKGEIVLVIAGKNIKNS